jgi:putative SOS response-associated peptidase YedK
VQVMNALPGVGTLIEDEAIPAAHQFELFRDVARREEDVPEHRDVFRLGVVHAVDVLAGYDQHVRRGAGAEIAEGDYPFVFEDDLRGNGLRYDVAEEAVRHGGHGFTPCWRDEHEDRRRPTLRSVCGRAALTASPDDLREAFGLDETPELAPHYNIPPSAPLHVVRTVRGRPGRRLETLRWGLVPPWASDPAIGQRLALGRVESVVAAPAFRHAIRRRRCLIAVDAFYEWQRAGTKTSQPFLLRRPDGKPFALAGVWEQWSSADGEVVESCAILTQPAQPSVAIVHDRMPVVLETGAWDAWLDPEVVDPDAIAPLLRLRTPDLVAVAVSMRVNNPRFDDPTCFEPYDEPQIGLFARS